MSGRILMVEGIATERAAHARLLREAGFDCTCCDGFEAALARLPDPGIDLVFAPAGIDETPAPAVLDFLRQLRARPGGERLPVVMPGPGGPAPARLALLEAGADEVAETPMPPALLQARCRNLMRARDTAEELARRAATHRTLGFAEAATGFTPCQRIAVIAPEAGERPPRPLDLPGKPRLVGPREPFAREGGREDLFVIDGAALRAEGHSPRELFRIVAELRSRSATRRAAQLVLLPEASREAAMLLDLGADDIAPADALPGEIAYRARRLLRRKALADRLRATERDGLQAALTDPLTGLWNRRYALPHLSRLIAEVQTRLRPIAVMLLDIDLFKAVNDRHGHAAGDAVLAQVAARLRDELRPTDLLARIGGEEFLVAMPDTSLEQARVAAERLRRRIRDRPFDLAGDMPCRVTISVGVAVGPREDDAEAESGALMRRADAALYAAKETGRNRVTVSLTPL